jgi:hypothetical protein
VDIFKPIKTLYKKLSGDAEREELFMLVKEWDQLLSALVTRVEGIEGGYEFLRKSMILRRELDGWKRLAVVSIVLSVVSVGCCLCLLLFRCR